MKQSNTYQSLKITKNNPTLINDNVVIEAPLQINVNNSSYTVVMRTPGDDSELIRGLLFAEDICKNQVNLLLNTIEYNDDHSSIVNVSINKNDLGKGYLNKRTLLSVSSCGICGKQELKDLNVSGKKLQSELNIKDNTFQKKVIKMFSAMKSAQTLFLKTGGSHACAIFNNTNELLTLKEDIGRHNAVDKCVGDLIHQQTLKQARYMLVSGRVSYEIVSKAFFAKISIIIAVSACSSLAIDFAKEFGICLIGFSRNDNMTIYTNPKKIYEN